MAPRSRHQPGTTAHPSRVTPLLLGAMLVVPGAWAGHLLVSYALVPAACEAGSSVRLHATTITALVVGGAAVWWSLRMRRPAVERGGPTAVLAQIVVALSAYFTLVIAVVGLVAVVQSPCS